METVNQTAASINNSQAEHKKAIAIAATFTSEPIAETLNFWVQELGLDLSIQFAPYNQIFQQLLAPDS